MRVAKFRGVSGLIGMNHIEIVLYEMIMLARSSLQPCVAKSRGQVGARFKVERSSAPKTGDGA